MRQKNLLFVFMSVSLGVFTVGCNKQEPAPQAQLTSSPQSVESVPTPAATSAAPVLLTGEGIIRGRVLYNGTVPQREIIDMAADPVCSGAHSEPVLSDSLVVNSEKQVRDAFIYVNAGIPADANYPIPSEPAQLDQQGCHYTPHVIGVQVNQLLVIVNSDPTLHNVHGLFQKSPEFNLGMPVQGMKSTKKFSAPEIMAKIKCDVHPWMSAYVGIVPHPFFAVTGDDGSFEIKGLPAGDYMLQVWHEKLGIQNIPVTVEKTGVSEIIVNYNPAS